MEIDVRQQVHLPVGESFFATLLPSLDAPFHQAERVQGQATQRILDVMVRPMMLQIRERSALALGVGQDRAPPQSALVEMMFRHHLERRGDREPGFLHLLRKQGVFVVTQRPGTQFGVERRDSREHALRHREAGSDQRWVVRRLTVGG